MGYGQGQTEMARDTDRQAVAEAGLGGLRQEEEQKWSPAGKEPEREPRAGSGWWQSPRLRGEPASIPGPHSLAPAPLAVSACPGTEPPAVSITAHRFLPQHWFQERFLFWFDIEKKTT